MSEWASTERSCTKSVGLELGMIRLAGLTCSNCNLFSWELRESSPDVGTPWVDVDESRLDVDSPGPDGQTLSKNLNHIGLDVDSSGSDIQTTGGDADHAGVVVNAHSLHMTAHVL